MGELGFTGELAKLAARRPWTTLGLWAVLIGAALVAASGLGDVLTQEQDLLVETESQRAQELIDEARRSAGVETAMQEFVLVSSDRGLRVDDPDFQAALTRLVADLQDAEHVTAVVGPVSGVPGLVSPDGMIGLVQVTLDAENPSEATEAVEPALGVIDAADAGDELRVLTVGPGSVNVEFNELGEQTLQRGEAVGLPIALLVLVLVFGAVVAGLVPLVIAAVSIMIAMGLTALVGQITDLSFFIVSMITMIGLAVGIDYSLFVVQRFREERIAGRPVPDAIAIAGATATRAVFFSGLTVVIALLGLMMMPDTTMRSLGLGAILVVIASVAAALTALPALLGLLGDRINRLRVPFTHRGTDTTHRFWTRITRTVTARPIISVCIAAGLLLGAAAPYFTMEIGSNFIASLPEDSDVRLGFETLNDQFLGGVLTTPIVVSADDVSDPETTAAAEQLAATLRADEDYGEVTITAMPDSDLLVLEATTLLDPSTTEARTALERLRDEQIPQAFAGIDAEVLVAGEAAFINDFVAIIGSRTPWIFALVLGLSLLLLLLAFRSIVVPVKAIVMNLLSVGASYGLIVLVFQHGVGADLFGFQQTDVIEAWVPLFMFAVLFGLSMDYHVFLLSRIKERYDLTHDNSGSVAFGLSVTGAIITGAALIMVAVFAGFAAGDLVMFQQMGFGLAVAVILDATIVRSILVPAAMELLGDRNWYFPGWLGWLPEIHVEGTRHATPDVITIPEAAAPADLAPAPRS